MFNSFGPLEIILLLVIVLVIFGPKRLPQLGRQMGRGMREFKNSVTGDAKPGDDEEEDTGAGRHAALAAAPDAPAAPARAEPVEEPALARRPAPADVGAEPRS